MAKIKLIAILIVVAIFVGPCAFYTYGTAGEKEITVKKFFIKSTGNSGKQNYMVVDSDNNPYTIRDCFWRFQFRSTDLYLKLEEGKKYRICYYGWRIPIISEYKNIYKVIPLD